MKRGSGKPAVKGRDKQRPRPRRPRLSRRALVIAAVIVLLLAGGFLITRTIARRERPWSAAEARPGKWNVLLVSLDTTRPDHLAACGGAPVATPGLDRVRGGGFFLPEMISPAPITLAAHATIFTAVNPYHHGVRENTEYALPEGTPTLASCFRSAGYTTAAFVASFILNARFGLSQGFELYQDRLAGPEAGLGPATVELPGAIEAGRAVRWIQDYAARRRAGSEARPFFLFVHFFDAHAPYQPPSPFADQYRAQPYDGELAYQDQCLGQVLDALESGGEASRTLVWVVSDHGEALGEHGETTHSLFIYDATQRVVSLLRTPPADGRYRAGRPRFSLRQQAGLVDVAPTLCDLVGIPDLLPNPDGRSLAPLLSGSAAAEQPIYCETLSPWVSYHWFPLYGVRTSEWKYIRAPIPELYNLAADPREQTNLAAAQPAMIATMGQTLDQFFASLPASSGGKRPAAPAGRVPSEEELERLRSLGYIGGNSGGAEPPHDPAGIKAQNLPDPKRMIRFFTQQYEAASELLFAGRYDEAIAAFRESLRTDPQNNTVHLYLAGALRQSGRLAEAGRAYRDAVRIAPHTPRGWFGWGMTLLSADLPDSAAWAFRRSLELLPNSPDSWSQLGAALWRKGDVVSAAEAYEKALSHGADPVLMHGTMARLYREVPGGEARAQAHLTAYAAALSTTVEDAAQRLPAKPVRAGAAPVFVPTDKPVRAASR